MKKKIRWKVFGSPSRVGSISPVNYIITSKTIVHSLFILLMLLIFPDVESKIPENTKNATLFHIDCRNLKVGQFHCPPVKIDAETQQPEGCTVDNLAPITCELREGLVCNDDQTENVHGEPRRVHLAVACEYTNGYSYEVALLLSIFLGMFGVDRFYLGYPAIGLLKFCTLGFLFLGQFIDIILIAMQIVRPADGSYYIIKYFGPKLNIINSLGLNDAAILPRAQFVSQSVFDIYFYPNFSEPSV